MMALAQNNDMSMLVADHFGWRTKLNLILRAVIGDE